MPGSWAYSSRGGGAARCRGSGIRWYTARQCPICWEDRRPHRTTRGGRVVDLQTVIGIMERPENRKKSRHRNLNTRVHEEKVKQAVPVRIVSAVGMRRGEIAGAGEHGGPSRHTARDGL